MDDALPDPLACPDCGVLLRDARGAWACPACGRAVPVERAPWRDVDDGELPGIHGG